MGVGVSNVFDRGAPKASKRMSNHALCLCFVCLFWVFVRSFSHQIWRTDSAAIRLYPLGMSNMTPDPMHDDSPKAASSQRHISTADVNWPVEPTWSPRAADSS